MEMMMQPISVARYWEMVKIEEERAPVYDELLSLRCAGVQLRELRDVDFASWPEGKCARDQLRPLIRQLEDQNKDLAKKSFALWEQILQIDGPQLASAEIKRQQIDAASGMDWLWRMQKHLWAIVDGLERDEILLAVSAFYWELASEVNRLREAQRKHQRLQAERLALQALGPAS